MTKAVLIHGSSIPQGWPSYGAKDSHQSRL